MAAGRARWSRARGRTEAAPGTFLLGVGCQRGATSWLHQHLASSPESDFGFRKEYHVFDSLDVERGSTARQRVVDQARSALQAIEAGVPADPNPIRRALFCADVESYFDYFTALLSAPGIRLTGDITPAYAELSAGRFKQIRTGFESRGVRPVVLLVLRDPVERIWSATRMDERRRPGRLTTDVAERVRTEYADHWNEGRTRYDRTMRAVEAAFPSEQVRYVLYEELFAPPALAELEASLGIAANSSPHTARVNAAPEPEGPLPDETRRAVAEHYRSTYDAVAARLGADRVRRHWTSSRWVLD